ncbi:MAG: LysR family transcriptional regulator [Myxococcales bacterium]|nr:LysR family transcriptional regulator [Myxococcales bacterium]
MGGAGGQPSVELEWDHYRTFEAIARTGSLTRAAKVLGASQSTVSRHLARLEERARTPLVVRRSPIELTERGRALLEAVVPMIAASLGVADVLDVEPEARGEVTLSTVGEVARWVLAPRLGAFCRAYPNLRLRLLATNERVSLASGEADLAIRLARPEKGDLWAKRLGTETYGLFAGPGVPEGVFAPWVGLAGSLAHVAEQSYAERLFPGRPARVLVEDLEALGTIVEQGLGAAVLPRAFAKRLRDVVEVEPARFGCAFEGIFPSRDFFLVVHRTRRSLPKVRAVVRWVEAAWSESALGQSAARSRPR